MINFERVYKHTTYVGFIILLFMIGTAVLTEVSFPWWGYAIPIVLPTIIFLAVVFMALILSHYLVYRLYKDSDK